MSRALVALLFSLLLSPVVADERAATQQQLEQAQKDITELKKLLGELQAEKSDVQKALKKTESEMGQLEKQVKGLQEEQQKSQQELERLNQEKKKLQDARLEQQRLIGIQARAAYQSGQQEYVKLLLNQQHPEKFSRTLTYYNYLNQARLDQLATFNETLRQLGNVERDINQQQQMLAEQSSALQGRRDQLAAVRQERQQALSKLNKDLASRDARLKERQQAQVHLNNVLKTIEETLARQAREAAEQAAREKAQLAQQLQESAKTGKPVPLGPAVSTGQSVGGPFAKAQGRLPWPVNGRLLARYGSARGDDPRAKWDGVLIGASAGSQVRAVHGGRVVFADWLRGAGLLVIVDHGGGYLTLYGHNQSLLKDAGDIVKAGDPIATVGTSGGHNHPALYFAIRQQGRASDPARWCRAQG